MGNMADTVRNAMKRLLPVSSVAALLGVIAAVGVLSQVYQGANADLTGWRFLLSILLAFFAIVLIVESVNRSRSGTPWHALTVVGLVAGLGSVLVALLPVSHGNAGAGNADAGDGELRFSIRPTAPELFHVAFREPISLPSAGEGWAQLRHRGATDVGDSRFHMILANETSEPISVLNVHAEVLGSEPMPHGTDAWRASQGEEGVGQMTALLPNGRKGSVGPVYDDSIQTLEPEELAGATPYFQSTFIRLAPGEVYPVSLTVKADAPRTIEYRMIAEGESAERRFEVKTPTFRIVGGFEDPYQRRFARYYTKGYLSGDCTPTPDNPWVDARNTAHSDACPYGLGRPYEVPLARPSEYPTGKFKLSLGLTEGKQSATISGVVVGSEPAARPTPDVAQPLLRTLGAWTTCTRQFPGVDYWTARWFRWDLDVIFAAEDEDDCTPSSSAPVVEIELSESRELIRTDLGSIELGAPAAWLPSPIAEILTAKEGGGLERDLVAPGVSLCDPMRPVPTRTQLDNESPGGIVALSENQSSNELTGLSTTLPYGEC